MRGVSEAGFSDSGSERSLSAGDLCGGRLAVPEGADHDGTSAYLLGSLRPAGAPMP